MAGHTPGPWAVDRENDVLSDGGDFVAAVFGDETCREEANARLIAAAPDLLAEVEQCAIELEEAANVFDGSGFAGLARIYRGASKRAAAALAKALSPAEGEE